MRPLITLVHIKDVRRSGYFIVDSDLSVDINASKTKIYEDIKFLIEKGLVEKQEFKSGSVYRCVGRMKYHKVFGVKRENFSNKVLVEKKDKNHTNTYNSLLLKILEQSKNQQEYNGFKKRVSNQDFSKTFLKRSRAGWFSRRFNNSVIFDDRGIAELLGISKTKANSLKHYLVSRNLLTISLLYTEVASDVKRNKLAFYNSYYNIIYKDIPHVTYLDGKIVYSIGTEYKFKIEYSKFNGDTNKYLL